MSSAEAGTPPLQALLDAFIAHDVDAIMSGVERIAIHRLARTDLRRPLDR